MVNNGLLTWNSELTFTHHPCPTPHKQMTINMGYLYILAKMLELVRPVIALLRGKGQQLSYIDCFGQMYYLLLIYIGFIFRPFGVFILLPFVDLLHHTFVYVYLIFACTGTCELTVHRRSHTALPNLKANPFHNFDISHHPHDLWLPIYHTH